MTENASIGRDARRAIMGGAWLGGLAVAAGAFGAHALPATLPPADLEIYETAVRYQLAHALALIALAAVAPYCRRFGLVARTWFWGTAIFSGSLYFLVLTGPRALGAVTPIGGTVMLIGWLALATGFSLPRSAPVDLDDLTE